jgi:tetratricopeptide (TPR) repeat protein
MPLQPSKYARRLLVIGLAASSICRISPASADDAPAADNVLKSRALFAEGRSFVQAGNYEQACAKFEESLRLNDGIGTQFNLADCWEHIGRTASARSLFLGAAASAHAAGQAEREQVAKARADALEPRLLRLVIDVQATDPELRVRRNHVVVARDAWGSAVAVDAGAYLIEASASGKKAWSSRITVPVNASEPISVSVPPLEDANAACEPKSAATSADEVGKSPAKPRSNATPPLTGEAETRSPRRTAYALSLAGLGVAAVATGTVLALEYQSKNEDAKAICPSSVGCSQADIDNHAGLVSDAKGFRTWSFVGFGVGGAALIGATVLYFAPSSPTQRAFVTTPFVTADGSWGATVSGKF